MSVLGFPELEEIIHITMPGLGCIVSTSNFIRELGAFYLSHALLCAFYPQVEKVNEGNIALEKLNILSKSYLTLNS